MLDKSPGRSDLVISMTLAETFLLLVFVVWYGEVAAGKDTGTLPDWQKVAGQRQKEIDRLKADIEREKSARALGEAALKWWQDNFRIGPPVSAEELVEALRTPAGKAVLMELARGYPRCEQDNVLVHASVLNGKVRMRVVGASKRLRAWCETSGIILPKPKSELTDWRSVRTFLDVIRRFYGSEPVGGKACRFDYQLSYQTKADYFDGRESFEKSFYAARIARASAGGD